LTLVYLPSSIDQEYPVECDDEYWEHSDPEKAFHQPPGVPSYLSAWVSHLKLMDIISFAQRTIVSPRAATQYRCFKNNLSSKSRNATFGPMFYLQILTSGYFAGLIWHSTNGWTLFPTIVGSQKSCLSRTSIDILISEVGSAQGGSVILQSISVTVYDILLLPDSCSSPLHHCKPY
jgi:hypothetical protein